MADRLITVDPTSTPALSRPHPNQQHDETAEIPTAGIPSRGQVHLVGPESAAMRSATDLLRAAQLSASEGSGAPSSSAITSPPASILDMTSTELHTEPSDLPVLLRMDGVQAGEVLLLTPLPFLVGRHPSCQLVIDDPSVSRRHAQVYLHNGEMWLRDLGSRNGTFVDGRQLEAKRLTDGTLLQIGNHTSFRFTVVSVRQARVLRELFESSTRDALTGLYNRRHFDERFKAELAFAKRHRVDLGLIMVDIDHFKNINDNYGHATGDLVLMQTAAVLARQLRIEDLIARIGGEEFAVLLRGIGPPGCSCLAERLRLAVQDLAISAEGLTIKTTISAGCACISETSDATSKSLLQCADERLYTAKHEGRNRVVAG